MSEHGIRTVSRNGTYLFHATLEHNSYVFKPAMLPTSSRVLANEVMVLAAGVISSTTADLWHLCMGHLNVSDMCKLKSKATGILKFLWGQTCVMAKMRRTPFQNKFKGGNTVQPNCLNKIYVLTYQGLFRSHQKERCIH